MTSWKTYKIGDLCKISSSKRIFAKEYKDSGIPFYRGKEIIEKQKGNKISTELYISQERYEEIKTKHGVPKKGDMLLTSVGTLGIPYIVQDEVFYFKDGNLTWFYDFDGLDSHYLYYWFLSPVGKMNIDSKAIGSTQKALTIETLSKFEISLPPLAEQRRIAGILGAIDDKIENNRRINTNLELQAQALYKQWFVDNRSDNWEEKPLSEIAEFIGGYSYKGNELIESSSTAMATIKNFERKGGFKVDGFKDIVASSKLKAEQHAELFDILVAHTDLTQNADVIGNAEILLTFGCYTDIIFSMDLVKVLPKSNFPYKYLLAALLKNPYFKAHCLGYINGTTVLHMSKKALPEYVVACPPNSEAEKMDMAFKVYYHKMAEILQENETLATLRYTLLPKLMNGEIKTE